MQAPAHDTYAKELWSLKHGHPLWSPEPSPAFGEVRLGDVGYLDEGRFCFLFNAMRPAGDPVNKRGVPEDFQTFVPPDPNSIQYYPDKITQPELHSGSISSLSVSVGASLKELGASAEAALRYECKQTSGALLLLKENAHKTYLDCGNHIKRYMAAHIEHWYDFASECLGIDVQEQDILFVSGFTKTFVWAEAAFHSGSAQGELLVAAGCFAPAAGGEFRVTMSRARDASVASRIGPSQRVKKDYTPMDGAAASEAEFDQCIFLNYHKAKRRKPWRPLKVIRAAAGPHDLPRPPGSSGSGSSGFNSTLNSSTTTGELGSQHTFNPVNHLLDYTLDNSDAAVACVSDADLADLFQGRTLPDDLRGDLEFQSAPITVDGTGSEHSTRGLYESVSAAHHALYI
ncbi:hypothetical protein OH76DRAFT_1421293 [Lentinus brumalis]|uniref:Uncharacterized protein n=1 Tax=Lentinus brumalis TaxID=2498619 RepID=A0A371CW76_9APHY|nr:hypothetical protein OH76DRAFT_1421293 [Polyporus brumalis]